MVTVKELKSRFKIHEHDFNSRSTESETLLICSTCGLLYCEKCGRLVKKTHRLVKKTRTAMSRMRRQLREG